VKVRSLLRFDSLGGLAAGALMLILRRALAEWERLPVELLTGVAAANLIYGSFSGTLAVRAQDPDAFYLRLLVRANAAWALVCWALAAVTWNESSWWGKAHLLGEGVFVGALEWVEQRVFFKNAGVTY
jgi:hypothetical protein